MAKKAASIETPETTPAKKPSKKSVSTSGEVKQAKPKTVKKAVSDDSIPVKTTRSKKKASAAPESSGIQDAVPQPQEEHLRVAAYYCWIDRGMPFGTPEDDWCEAEKQFRG